MVISAGLIPDAPSFWPKRVFLICESERLRISNFGEGMCGGSCLGCRCFWRWLVGGWVDVEDLPVR